MASPSFDCPSYRTGSPQFHGCPGPAARLVGGAGVEQHGTVADWRECSELCNTRADCQESD